MSENPASRQDEIAHSLGAQPGQGRLGRVLRWGALALAAAAIVVGVASWRAERAESGPQYRTEEAKRGPLVVTVSATGRLQPTNQVDIGSELSGTVERVFVDNNDRVKKGQVLARLDVSKLQDQVTRSRAALAASQAQLAQMQATAEEARANLARLQQVAQLSGGKVPSKAELEAGEAALKRAVATEASARAAIGQSAAALKSDETNLAKASIRSPIDGIVLSRKVEPGQTVAASLQAPVLFTLAENLAQMKLEVDVDEADVGQVREGQEAAFNVDAYAARRYPSRVVRVGYGSQVKENVVSYLTVLEVANEDLSLRPGMTATAQIVTARRDNVLLVPNGALRFTPPLREAKSKQASGGIMDSLIPRPPRPVGQKAPAARDGSQRVWILRDGQPAALKVRIGVTDGRQTEIVEGELQPGMAVITELVSAPK